MSPRLRLVLSIVILLGVLIVGAVGYRVIEVEQAPSFLDAVYMTVITVSTVGYREIWTLSDNGKLWTIGVILLGIATVSYAFTSLISVVIGGELRSMRESKKMQKTIQDMRDHVILCGYGRMGSLVVRELQKRGVPVVVIEMKHELEEELTNADIHYLIGDATDEELFHRAGLMHARALVTILPSDADNVFVTLTAHTLRTDLTIVARAEAPATEAKLIRAGASRVVSPQRAGAMRVTNILTRPAVVDFVELADKGVDLEIDEYVVADRSPLCGKTLRESGVRNRSDAIVVAVKRLDGTAIFNPDAETSLHAGDTLILVGRTGMSDRLDAIDSTVD